jgi:hypothetical protein
MHKISEELHWLSMASLSSSNESRPGTKYHAFNTWKLGHEHRLMVLTGLSLDCKIKRKKCDGGGHDHSEPDNS